MSVEFLEDEHWRATVVQRAFDSLVASVEQMRRALDLCQETNAILKEIKKTLHAQVRGQVGAFLWMEAGEFVQAKPGGLTVLQTLCERERATAFNQTDDKPSEYFVNAIQDFMIAREGKTPTRKVRNTARNAWRDDPVANRRIRAREQSLPGEGFRSPYRGQPTKYDPDVVLAFADALARSICRPQISWTRTSDNKSRGVMLDVVVAAVEWAMCVAWQSSGRPGSRPPKVNAGGIIGILKAKRPLTNSTD